MDFEEESDMIVHLKKKKDISGYKEARMSAGRQLQKALAVH